FTMPYELRKFGSVAAARPSLRFLAVTSVAAMLGTAACGSNPSPAAPSPPSVVAGNWTGTMSFTSTNSAGQTTNSAVVITMALTQTGSTVSGTWAVSGANGTVAGATTNGGTFSGTFTFNAVTVSGAPCTGIFAVSGTETPTTVNWTSPGVTANCTA